MGKHSAIHNRSGFALIFVFFFVILVAGIVLGYLNMNSLSTASVGAKQMEMQTFYAAEAAQARAVQYLQNDWAGIWNTLQPNNGALGLYGPITENLSTNQAISYDFIVDNWNLAYNGPPAPPAPFGAVASAGTTQAGNVAARAIDGLTGNGQFWRSQPPFGASQWIQINFPAGSNYTINECIFRSLQGGANQIPRDYSWIITPAAGPPTTITINGNASAERYDFFVPVSNVSSVQLLVTAITGGNSVRIDEIEIPWIRIKSRCRINSTSGSSYTEKYIRSCVLTNSRSAPATITKIIPSVLPGTNITSIWDEISYDTYNDATQF